ncbi:hypothetical protein [Nonomuraea longicatena]|uniref:TIGR04222 domain-containing membrane protein n=1 Tax=Nonomuraea longicatena TaxID=83682 RepID=A0ABN1NS11_9ACTN
MERYVLAYLSGGRDRVALSALAMLLLDGRLKLSESATLYAESGASAADPVEAAGLAQRDGVRQALVSLAGHESVLAVEGRLLRGGLVERGRFRRTTRLTADGQALLAEAARGSHRLATRVELSGVPAIPDHGIRALLGMARRRPVADPGTS